MSNPYERALAAGQVIQRADPLNCETPITALLGGVIMPTARFYVRSHFPIPPLDASSWRLSVSGQVERPLSLSLSDLRVLPSRAQVVTLECAGNGRSQLRPAVEGEQWGVGAVSTAEWAGVPLSEVLDRAGVRPEASELVFRGADSGPVSGSTGSIRFERSLSLGDARGSDALLAYAMNGETLPVEHGYPVRVIVPGWYGVASVKWLTEIEVSDQVFSGYFQADRYVYEWERAGQAVREPLSRQRVRSLVVQPAPEEVVPAGVTTIRGVAWSGAAPVARVEVSVADGPWQEAGLVGESRPYCWQWWELRARLDRPGPATVRARATDQSGQTQPAKPEWNRLGYGANAIHGVPIRVS